MRAPETLQQAVQYFGDFDNCKQFMLELRWPDGTVKCPDCGSSHVVWLANARLWKCYSKHPRPKFSLKTGTIFEDSPLGLDKWLAAVWLLCNCKNGISSYEIARDLGVSQKSAWHMMHRIRFALYHGSFNKFSGHVEADETFIGGKARNMHQHIREQRISRNTSIDKTAVMGILQRGNKETGTCSKVYTSVIPNRRKPVIQAEVKAHVQAGSAIYSDALKSYEGLEPEFTHQMVDHAIAYVDGNVHTNGLENFWSLLKRGLHGTYVSVEPFHLFRYLDEQVFRYNNRKYLTDFDRFKLAMSQIVGKRLTWNSLTGKDQATTTQPN